MPIELRRIADRKEWLTWRRKDITASDAAAIFGLSPWKSAFAIWAEKTGRITEPFESPIMKRGRLLEPAVLEYLGDVMPTTRFERPNVYVRNPESRIGATPDAVAHLDTGDEAIVECKVVGKPTFEAWDGKPPIAYEIQTLINMMLWPADRGILACLVIDAYSAELHTFDIERDEAIETRIRNGVKDFWILLESGQIPQADYALDGELLAQLYKPREHIEPIDLSLDNRLPELLVERESVAAEMKAAGERLDAIKAELIEKLAGSPLAICGDWKISNKLVTVKEHVRKASTRHDLRITRRKAEAA